MSKRNVEEPAPGSFYTGPHQDRPTQNTVEQEVKELAPEVHEDLVEKYKVFIDSLHPKLDVIYHPSNANDVSPSAAFPNSRVIYVDIDKNAVDALSKAGYESHYGSAAGPIEGQPDVPVYTPDVPSDIVILLNPQITSEIPSKYLKSGGYILANDYHGNATQLHSDAKFEIAGIIRNKPGRREFFLDTEHPEDYWKEIETEEEFKAAPFSWGGLDYITAKETVESLTGKTDNVLAEYKKIIVQAREEERRFVQEQWNNRESGFQQALKDMDMFGADPNEMNADQVEAARVVYDKMLQKRIAEIDSNTEFMFRKDGQTTFIHTKLPSKKGVVDDYFVFKKLKS